MADIALETRGLTVRFGGVTAVDNVDFVLRQNELRCLIGPNGAGKTTFFKCLTGLLKPASGEVYVGDQRTTGWDPHRVAGLGVGIKTQVPSVMDGLSVRENIWLGARRRRGSVDAARQVSTLIERLDLGRVAQSLVGRLAHGERQRVELASVLAGDPWLVLLDEPAAGMTGAEVEMMAALIRDMNKTMTIVVVEHDMQFIRQIAGLVTVFYQGAILVEDEVGAVMSDARVRDVYLGKKG